MEKIFIFVDSSKCWIASCIPVELKIFCVKADVLVFPYQMTSLCCLYILSNLLYFIYYSLYFVAVIFD